MIGLVPEHQIIYYHMITIPVKENLRRSITTKGSRTWRPGEGVLLDGFVVGVEGGLKEEDGSDAAGQFRGAGDFGFGKSPGHEGLKSTLVFPTRAEDLPSVR